MSILQHITYQHLCELIDQWNENRLDLFSLSRPNENMEFYGVMRFYFQEPGEKVATKCVRVSSSATTRAVIAALVEKFHPDMKMLTQPVYSIWEVHENGQERKLEAGEHPLLAQLNWHKDDLEGRFLLRRDDFPRFISEILPMSNGKNEESMRRSQKRFSKREKKELRKKYKTDIDEDSRSIYAELPQTTFTRTISNPEIVMQKRREKKLEGKLKEIGHGGSLKIYGVDLFPDRPYVTLLVGMSDSAAKIVREALDKYGREAENSADYVLVEVTLSQNDSNLSRSLSDLKSIDANQERFLKDGEYPLLNLMNRPDSRNLVYFLRRRPKHHGSSLFVSNAVNYTTFSAHPTTCQMHRSETALNHTAVGDEHCASSNTNIASSEVAPSTVPYLIQLDANGNHCNRIAISSGVAELGTGPQASIQIHSNYILPRHCCFRFVDGQLYVAPLNRDALVEVNGELIDNFVQLKPNSFIKLGGHQLFQVQLDRPQPPRRRPNSYHSTLHTCGSQPLHSDLEHCSNTRMVCSATTPSMSSRSATHFGASNGNLAVEQNLVQSQLSESGIYTSTKASRMALTCVQEVKEIPALLDVSTPSNEDKLLRFGFFESHLSRFSFRLTPAFVLYMVCRHRLSQFVVPPQPMERRLQALYTFIGKFTASCMDAIYTNSSNPDALIFWLANSSEFLHMVKTDAELRVFGSYNLHNQLLDLIEKTYELFVEACRISIRPTLYMFLNADIEDKLAASDLLNLLEELIRLVRRSLLNSALTIQIFSQLFHYINMYAFNWLVKTQEGKSFLTFSYGIRLRERLSLLFQWSERQGLEQACECHLDRIQQTVNLLVTPKTTDQIASLGATCYKLNSIQIRYLLENFIPNSEQLEQPVSADLVEHVVCLAREEADVMALQDCQSVQLEETYQLQLPFLFPQDSYFVEILHGIPAELMSFIVALQEKGLAKLLLQNSTVWTNHMPSYNANNANQQQQQQLDNSITSSSISFDNGSSTAKEVLPENNDVMSASTLSAPHLHMATGAHHQHPRTQQSYVPQITEITIHRAVGEGIGLSIVSAQSFGVSRPGIYVKKIFEGTPAFKDGRFSSGDQLLAVNGVNLVGVSQEEAAHRISTAGQQIHFHVAKLAAQQQGLNLWQADSVDAVSFAQASGSGPSSFLSSGGVGKAFYSSTSNIPQKMSGRIIAQQQQRQQQQLTLPNSAQQYQPQHSPINGRYYGGAYSMNNNKSVELGHNQLQHQSYVRSASASELLTSTDSASIASGSVSGNGAYGNHFVIPPPNVPPHQPDNNNYHQRQASYSKLPSHYRFGRFNNNNNSTSNDQQSAYHSSSAVSSLTADNYSPSLVMSSQTLTACSAYSAGANGFGSLSQLNMPNGADSGQTLGRLINNASDHQLRQPSSLSSTVIADYGNLPSINDGFITNNSGSQEDDVDSGCAFSSLPSTVAVSGGASLNQHNATTVNDCSMPSGSGTANPNLTKLQKFAGSPAVSNASNTTSPLPPPPPYSGDGSSGLSSSSRNSLGSAAAASPNAQPSRHKLSFDSQYGRIQQQYQPHHPDRSPNSRRLFSSPSSQQPPYRYKPPVPLPAHAQQTSTSSSPQTNVPAAFGRRSAPLFTDECTDSGTNDNMTAEELNEELKRLDAKEVVTDADKHNYRRIVERLSGVRASTSKLSSNGQPAGRQLPCRQVHSASVLGFEHPSLNHHRQQQSSCFLPFMSEMESRLESRSGSGKTPRRSCSGLVDSTFGSQSTVENLIDDMSDVANRLNRMPIDDADALRATTLGLLGNFPSHSSHSTSSSTGSGSGGGSASSTIKTSLREYSVSPDTAGNASAKKRVQFRDDPLLDAITESAAEDHHLERGAVVPSDDMRRTIDEPRVQTIGVNEVYNDPRQRRLEEKQQQAKTLRPVVDGANLGFRDKMKLFADQLGEQLPRNRHKVSSVEREIEQDSLGGGGGDEAEINANSTGAECASNVTSSSPKEQPALLADG